MVVSVWNGWKGDVKFVDESLEVGDMFGKGKRKMVLWGELRWYVLHKWWERVWDAYFDLFGNTVNFYFLLPSWRFSVLICKNECVCLLFELSKQ